MAEICERCQAPLSEHDVGWPGDSGGVLCQECWEGSLGGPMNFSDDRRDGGLRVYLAARYSRRGELTRYRAELNALGYDVTSRWLDGNHQIADDGMPIGEDGEALVEGYAESERAAALRRQFAHEDLVDIQNSDVLVAFTEPPRSSASRGGRHVELGYAIGLGRPVIVVGYRENVFCWLPEIRFARTWPEAKLHIKQVRDQLEAKLALK